MIHRGGAAGRLAAKLQVGQEVTWSTLKTSLMYFLMHAELLLRSRASMQLKGKHIVVLPARMHQ
jgi:hypothetical protein